MKYSTGNAFRFNGSEVRVEIDLTQFGDLEVITAFEIAREFKERMIYKVGVGGTIIASPLLHDSVLYFGCADKNFYAVTKDGKELWRFGTEGPIIATSALEGNNILFGSYDGNLYCLDLKGRFRWKFSTEGKIFSRPCIHDGRVFFGSYDYNFYCLDIGTGKEIWKISTGGPVTSDPFVKDGKVFFSSDDSKIYSAYVDKGKMAWVFPTRLEAIIGRMNSVPVYKNLFFAGNWDSNLYAISIEGRLLWKFPCGDVSYYASVHNDRIFFGSRDFNLYSLDADTGKKHWSYPTGGLISAQPLVFNDCIYFGSGDGNFYCINLGGDCKWKINTGGPIASSAYADEKAIYFGSWDCNLYAVSHEGKLLWKFPTSLGYQSPIDLESPQAREMTHQVLWSQDSGERLERYQENLPNRLSDYGDQTGTYQSIGMRTDYMSGGEKKYKSKSEYK